MLKTLSTVWPYLQRYRKGLALGIVSLVLKDLLAVALPLVFKQGVDSLKPGFHIRTVLLLAGLLIGLAIESMGHRIALVSFGSFSTMRMHHRPCIVYP